MDLRDELANAAWRKASFSSDNGGNCIEIAPLSGGRVAMRDTEAPGQEPFVVSAGVWSAFVSGAKAGEFDF
ncbi:DUF397 domain-containing protein [Acrocarpospora sp. B8E8]|uniref:DUF397 domain-containing protein n=1 Tax=Acrocarpospora sp. B8E8 TaxID=3153572 RepID=UPI00325EF9E9